MVMLKKSEDVSPQSVDMPGARGLSIRRLIARKDGAHNFAMRLFQVEPEGCTPRHRHAHEHEVYVLSGRGVVFGAQGEMSLEPGSVVLVLPEEEHQFKNSGSQPLIFLCMVPAMADL
jgi:quercetin dioxygenase-like cupin family protein